MNSFTFTDSELKAAAAQVRDAMLSSLPDPGECTHEFSEDFKAKMRPLFAEAKRKQRNKGILRTIAAIFILLFISMTVWLSVDAEAREAVLNWVRQVYEDRAIYTFDTVAQPGELPEYEVTWIPEGFEVMEEFGNGTAKGFWYHNEETAKDLVFEYYSLNDGSLVEVVYDKGTQVEKVTVNGVEGDYYYDKSNVLMWIDKSEGIVFVINSPINKEDIIHIAESNVKK